MEFRDLKRQYQNLKPQLDSAMQRVAAGAHYIMGPEVAELEAELARYVGVKHCISCANGTDALQIALKVWNIGPGEAVFVPDFTFFSTAEVVAAEGAAPVFVDVRKDTFNMDPADLECAVKATLEEGRLKPAAVIAVDLFGLPADYPAIRAIAEKYGLRLLEDGAQGFGGSIGDKRACSFGDIATTSFFPAKPLGCYGDGGAIFTDSDEWAALARSYRVHGKGDNKYDNVRIGMNSRLDTLQAAILKVKLEAFRDSELCDIQTAASIYDSLLDGLSGIALPMVPQGFSSSWAQYTIRLKDRETRDSLQAFLKEKGIPSMVYYPIPMSRQSAFSSPVSGIDCTHEQASAAPVLGIGCSVGQALAFGKDIKGEDTMSEGNDFEGETAVSPGTDWSVSGIGCSVGQALAPEKGGDPQSGEDLQDRQPIPETPRHCPAAAELSQTVLSLPISPYITHQEQKQIAEAITAHNNA